MLRALNHATAPDLGLDAFVDLAAGLGCAGIEFRNDLGTPLFGGMAPEAAGERVRAGGLRLLGLSQVYPFNAWSAEVEAKVTALIATARAAGAETISLIPRNDGLGLGNGERRANLRLALREILPLLEAADLVALVEPLGFEWSSLRDKAEAVEVIEAVGGAHRFKLVHDTFHHHLAGGGAIFAAQTGIVHISGVTDPRPSLSQMRDAHRGLVNAEDRLQNLEQLDALFTAGYAGPVAYECFAPQVQALAEPGPALAASFEFIASRIKAQAA